MKKTDLTDFLKSHGCRLSWDRRNMEWWHEVNWKDRVWLQIQGGLSLSEFAEWLGATPDQDPGFFIASGASEEEFQEFVDAIWDDDRKEFKDPVPNLPYCNAIPAIP